MPWTPPTCWLPTDTRSRFRRIIDRILRRQPLPSGVPPASFNLDVIDNWERFDPVRRENDAN